MSNPQLTLTETPEGGLAVKSGWRCPFRTCGSHNARAFKSERGVRVHISRQHGVDWRAGCAIARLYRHWQ